MRTVVRLAVSLLAGISAFYFVFWVGGALLHAAGVSPWIALAIAGVCGIATARYLWGRRPPAEGAGAGPGSSGAGRYILGGALVVGGIAFAAGFFGPILLAPEANQGPLLGIFITGPLGFLLGGVGGGLYWHARARVRRREG